MAGKNDHTCKKEREGERERGREGERAIELERRWR